MKPAGAPVTLHPPVVIISTLVIGGKAHSTLPDPCINNNIPGCDSDTVWHAYSDVTCHLHFLSLHAPAYSCKLSLVRSGKLNRKKKQVIMVFGPLGWSCLQSVGTGTTQKSISGYPVCDGSIIVVWVPFPVITQGWQLVDSHENHESEICPHFLCSYFLPCSVPLVSLTGWSMC